MLEVALIVSAGVKGWKAMDVLLDRNQNNAFLVTYEGPQLVDQKNNFN